ncbi:MAG: tRNA pseudouridine(38-40) synthase TruA [Spirochaetaceae bacterium]|jgi:tRNA pseudouridine38-40 synthase|nr:tRNA pseudouridine(38-40) synthase TruA [Spirochaetaceae bacterium]
MSRNIRLLVAYDGTGFSGWQRQDKKAPAGEAPGGFAEQNRTVQGTLEQALARIHKHPVNLTGAGRTDAGVHAAGQVANFYTDIAGMGAERFVPALNSLLPPDLRVLEGRETIPDFHARFDASARTYRYHFICGRPALPHESRYGLQLWRRPRIALLNAYARQLLGERDCSVFAASGGAAASRSRNISGASFFIRGDTLIFEIRANAFLWKMVRSVAGTLLFYEERGIRGEAFRDMLQSGDRKLAGPTLPPRGLFLWKVDYSRG